MAVPGQVYTKKCTEVERARRGPRGVRQARYSVRRNAEYAIVTVRVPKTGTKSRMMFGLSASNGGRWGVQEHSNSMCVPTSLSCFLLLHRLHSIDTKTHKQHSRVPLTASFYNISHQNPIIRAQSFGKRTIGTTWPRRSRKPWTISIASRQTS